MQKSYLVKYKYLKVVLDSDLVNVLGFFPSPQIEEMR